MKLTDDRGDELKRCHEAAEKQSKVERVCFTVNRYTRIEVKKKRAKRGIVGWFEREWRKTQEYDLKHANPFLEK